MTTLAYDVFISYSHADRDWVRQELLPRLEGAGLKACIDSRDFEPGAPRVNEMERAVVTSRKTLLVLTPAYLANAWDEFGNLMLQTLDPAGRKRRLIPLLKEPCDLPPRIDYLIPVNFSEADDIEDSWSRLLSALDAPSASPSPKPPERQSYSVTELWNKLVERCSVSDLRDLCFVMGVDYQNYPQPKSDFARELVADMDRKGNLDELVRTIRREKAWVLR